MRKRKAGRRLSVRICASALLASSSSFAVAQTEGARLPAGGEAIALESEAPQLATTAATTASERQVYTPEDFARYAPRTALDMLRNVPGFSIEREDQERGLGQASGNVLINGQRVSSKSSSASDQLGRISAGDVIRIEIVDGATLNVPGLSGRVANVVARTGGMSGRFEWRPQYATGPAPVRWSQGDASISGTRGIVGYTLSLRNDSFYGGSGGFVRFIDRDGAVDRRRTASSTSRDRPTLGADLRFNHGEVQANLNLSHGWNIFRSREDEVRMGAASPPLTEALRTHDDGHFYEISGDIEFEFGPGRLKLIGLESYDTSDFLTQARLKIGNGGTDIGSRFRRTSDEGERIARAEYLWNLWGADWQLSTEAAFNRLDNVAALFVLEPAGEFVEISFPAGTGGVREDRYETVLSYGRPLTRTLSLQLTGGGEHSTISQTGANALSRSFLRPKGSLSLAWAPREQLDVSFEAARRVGQLDFGDFLAAVDLSDDNSNAGNNQLRPPQIWEFELEVSRGFGAWGSATATLFEERIEDFVTIVPVAGGLESRGNVPSARRRGYAVEGTWRFDPLGFTGAKLDVELLIEDSRLKDPVTGIERSFDRSRTKQIELDFRHDIVGSDVAWGTEFRHTKFAPYFRVAEYGFDYANPTFGAVFVEHKDVFGLTVRTRAANLFRGDTVLDRFVYAGPRYSAPLLFREDKRRELGIIFNLNVSGSF